MGRRQREQFGDTQCGKMFTLIDYKLSMYVLISRSTNKK